MSDSPDILRMRVLLCFFKKEENRTVMGISRTLKEAKQNVSRAMIALEKEGLLDRSNPRMPHLTDLGEKRAKYYAERMEITLNHLLYEGVDIENAKSDAFQWALLAQMSPQTLLYLLRQDTSSAPAA